MNANKDGSLSVYMAQRPGLVDPARPRLVGLRSADPAQPFKAGAHLVEPGSSESLGWVTSVRLEPSPVPRANWARLWN